MPLPEDESVRFKGNVDRIFADVARACEAIAREAQALLRASERADVPRDVRILQELAAATILDRLLLIERRLTQFERDGEDLRSGGDL